MSVPPFVHLHCHSHYSLLDGAGKISGLLKRTKELGMNSLALTDHGNLHGALEFYKTAKDMGVNPIVGIEAYIAPSSRFYKENASGSKEASYHITILAKDRTGFQNLLKLSSQAFLEGFYFRPRIDKELLAAHSEGLVCLSGCVSSELNRGLLMGGTAGMEKARAAAAWYHEVFGDRYFIEIQYNGIEQQRIAMEGAIDLANQMGLPLVATSDVHYVLREDAEAQDILLCVNTGKFRTDTNRMRMETNEFYLRSPEEMYSVFTGYDEALKRSQEIADSVHIDLELGKRHFPVFNPPDAKTSEDFLRELVMIGLKDRYAGNPQRIVNGELSEEVMARVDREMGVINKLGFANYFLIVWDFVRFARSQGIPATARGSGVGSLVAYGLYLSHVCPLAYDLLFERFLDESRREAPDIDIDFCQQRRGEVIQYVKERYGMENVAQIGTFGTMAARAAIRDVGRALGMPIPRVDAVVAMVPDELKITIKSALEKSDDLKKLNDSDPEIRELLTLAMKIEGLARNVGTHAAAVVIADRPLTDYVPLQHVQNKEEIITQWAMGDVEKAGLLKMDFLGLRNLTILSKVIALIEQTTGKQVDPYKFPLQDEETFALLCRGETKGVFQLESGGIRDLLQRMKPDHFRDIIATNALYRPGPLEGGMVEDYIQVKHGRKKPQYEHEVMEEVLAETHGVMVYQEQVMRILNRLGGIALANAYSCIKAISKKKLEMIAKYREEFIEGAFQKGMAKKKAEEVFGLIEKFAGYGFNKCVVGETAIIDADTGLRTTVGDLFQNHRDFRVHSLGEDGKIRPRRVTDVVWNGRKRVYELTTMLGKRITATANHPLRTLDGWKLLGELKPGDRIAAPRRLRVRRGRRWPRHEIAALAYLLSEGNTCHPTCLYSSQITPGLTSKDTVPGEVRQWVDAERRQAGLTWRDLQGESGVSIKEFAGRGSVNKRGFRRSTIARVAAFFGSHRLQQVAESDVYWDTVKSIEPRGVQDTYDLTVEEDHNFVADGLVVHNSHSTAYALIAYMTAYLKAHYKVEFMAALLSSDIPGRNFKKKDSLVEHIEDCNRMGIEVTPPDINRSDVEFAVGDGKIYYALSAIKGCGGAAATAIVKARKSGGPYRSIFDFCQRLDPGQVNRTAIESLVKAGALDSMGGRRSQWFAMIDRALQAGASAAADRRSGQKGLFDDDEEETVETAVKDLPDLPEWDEKDRLAKEKEVLGFYMSSHPLAEHAKRLQAYCSHTTVEAAALKHRAEVMIGGMIASIKHSHTKNPKPGNPSRYAMFDLEDTEGIMRCICWPEQFAQFGELIQAETICVLKGVIDKRAGSEEANMIINELIPIGDLEARYTRGVRVRVVEETHGAKKLETLYEILRGYPGECQFELVLCLADGRKIACRCDTFRIANNPEMRGRVEELLGAENFRLMTAKPSVSNGRGRS